MIPVLVLQANVSAQVSLDDASVWRIDLDANDAVYDRYRNVIYASVSRYGSVETRNTLAVLDLETGTVVHNEPMMSEPNMLALSADGSRVYIGLDDDHGYQYYEPETGRVGEFQDLLPYTPSTNIVGEFAIAPLDPGTVVVMHGYNSEKACVYNSTGFLNCASTSNLDSVAFIDPNTMISRSPTSSTLHKYTFDGEQLQSVAYRSSFMFGAGTLEAKGGLIYSSTGQVVEASTLAMLGTFTSAEGVVEPVPELGITYYLSGRTLQVFDNESFLEMDSKLLNGSVGGVSRLFVVGEGQLGYTGNGYVGIISGIPVAALCPVDLTGDGVLDDFDVSAFLLSLESENPFADLNHDSRWDFFDLAAFERMFKEGCP